jgi:hypothetical protein
MVYRVYPGGPRCYVHNRCWVFSLVTRPEPYPDFYDFINTADKEGVVYGEILPVEEPSPVRGRRVKSADFVEE